VVLVTAARGRYRDEILAAAEEAAGSEPGEASTENRHRTATALDRSAALAARWRPWLAAVRAVLSFPSPVCFFAPRHKALFLFSCLACFISRGACFFS
jgi:membrane protein YqaA with SNARE-associated domain